MNKFTFGKTPAAIYLADLLVNSTQSQIRKVTRTLANFNRLINSIEDSNTVGIMSAHDIGGLGDYLRNRALYENH